ncbi:MAG: Zn-ribbon domain-containing OB-fold protein [Acidimicrobiales bacterium]
MGDLGHLGRRDGFVLPDVDDPVGDGFWAGTAAGELRIQACGRCGARRMPPRVGCPRCRSTAVRWDAMSGRARIWSFVVAHPPLLPDYAAEAPYNVVVVELVEDPGIRLVGNVVAHAGARLDSVDPAALAVGAEVSVVFTRVAADVWLPQWVLTGTGGRGTRRSPAAPVS